jgi:DNA polymerase III delta prime subunit
MSVKLDDKYIKNKIKDKFGELVVYNPQHNLKILEKLTKLIADNSQQVQLENEQTDIQVTNTVQIMRFMLLNLTNIETNTWNNIDDIKLEEMLNLADGDFKKAINSLLDIMIEIGNDIAIQNIRKLNILNDKLLEMSEAIKTNEQIDKILSNFGLDREKLVKLQNGDEETLKEFQKSLIQQKNNKSKRGRPKKSNK